MKYEVIYKSAYAIVVNADSATEVLTIADKYDSDEMEFIAYHPEVREVNEKD